MKDETKCLRSGYRAKNGEPRVMPIVQSTTYPFDSTEQIAALFDMPTAHLYSRFSNPTVDAVEKKIADLEGGAAAMCTSSGQAANFLAILNICSSGDSILSATTIYGGTTNLFGTTLKRFGIECIFVDQEAPLEQLQKLLKPNTKAVFGETLANPALTVLDIEKFAQLAHSNNIPLIVDNTFATPIHCKPISYGADIVTHSTTKYMDGHAVQVGGCIVDGGTFDWKNGKFPEFTEPDASYHGVVYTRDFGNIAYIIKARMQLMRDFGCYPAAHSAFLLNMGIETLHIRMARYVENATKVAEFFSNKPQVASVKYPGLKTDPYYERAQKYLPKGTCGVLSIVLKGGRADAIKFMDALKLAYNEVHVADICTSVLHPASATHRQLSDELLVAAGVNPGMIRISVGLEHIDDILQDFEQALSII